ncbi:Uncharacterised protein [Janthinobacterium lividum]|nr:Uncharacterised protein [Janthinobacterium lividum]
MAKAAAPRGRRAAGILPMAAGMDACACAMRRRATCCSCTSTLAKCCVQSTPSMAGGVCWSCMASSRWTRGRCSRPTTAACGTGHCKREAGAWCCRCPSWRRAPHRPMASAWPCCITRAATSICPCMRWMMVAVWPRRPWKRAPARATPCAGCPTAARWDASARASCCSMPGRGSASWRRKILRIPARWTFCLARHWPPSVPGNLAC